jgi:hypothetical protein
MRGEIVEHPPGERVFLRGTGRYHYQNTQQKSNNLDERVQTVLQRKWIWPEMRNSLSNNSEAAKIFHFWQSPDNSILIRLVRGFFRYLQKIASSIQPYEPFPD